MTPAEVRIEVTTQPSPAQLAAWAWLWRRLLGPQTVQDNAPRPSHREVSEADE